MALPNGDSMLINPFKEFPLIVVISLYVSTISSSSKYNSTVLLIPISSSFYSSDTIVAVFIIRSK